MTNHPVVRYNKEVFCFNSSSLQDVDLCPTQNGDTLSDARLHGGPTIL